MRISISKNYNKYIEHQINKGAVLHIDRASILSIQLANTKLKPQQSFSACKQASNQHTKTPYLNSPSKLLLSHYPPSLPLSTLPPIPPRSLKKSAHSTPAPHNLVQTPSAPLPSPIPSAPGRRLSSNHHAPGHSEDSLLR